MATIKITGLTSIGANLTSSTVIPVVNMSGTPTTEKTLLGNIANVVLAGAGGNYTAAAVSILAQSVTNAAQPNITSVGTLTNLAISGNVTVNGNITSNGTAYVGNLSTTGVASITTLAVGTTANLGAVGNITITGGTAGQVLSTNGNGVLSWASDATTYGNSNVAAYLPTYTGNIGGNVVTANLFSGNGINLTNIAGANVSGTVGNANLAQFIDVSDVNNNFSYHIVLSAGSGDKSIHIDADDNLQYNPADGTLTATRVDATYVLADLQFSNGYPAANVTGLGNIATLNLDGNVSNLLTGNGTYIAIPTVPTVGNIATINLDGSNSNVLYGNGVFAAVTGGGANTGNVTFDDTTVQGDDSTLNLSAGADFTANLAYVRVRSGDVASHIHMDTGNNEAYDLIVGDDQKFVQVSSTGNIIMSSYDGNTSHIMTLDTDGNLILAGGNSIVRSVANSSLDTLNPNVSTMIFTPDAGYSSQSLVLDPTLPGHIHLRAPSANIDEPLANIFLGGETSSFEVGYHNGSAPNLFIHSGGNTWTFDNAGNLTFPRDTDPNTADPILTIVSGANPSITSTDASLAGPANLGISALNTIFTGFTGDAIKIYPDDGEISSTANLQIWANSGGNTEYSWTFDTTGNLTLPGNLVINGLTNVFGSNVALLQSNNDVPLLSVSSGSNGGVSSLWVEDIGNVGTSNIAAVYANPTVGSGIVRIAVGQNGGNGGPNLWDFGATGNLTLPGNTVAINFANGSSAFGNIVATNLDGNVSNLLTGNGTYVAIPVVPTVGNIATINLDGSSSNVLYGNGVFAVVAAPTVTQDITSNGAMSIMTYDGNLKYVNYATVEPSTGNIAGGNLSTTGAVTANTATITTGNITTINSGLLQNGNSNITITSNGNVSIQAAGSNVELVVTSTGANVTGTLTSTGKIGYASGSTVTQTSNRGNGVNINALAGTIVTVSASMTAGDIGSFPVTNNQVDTNNDIVLVQVVSPNLGNYNVIANPNSGIGGFYLTLQNISGFPISAEAVTIRFMVIKAPNA